MAAEYTQYIAAGGNRHPAAAAWDTASGLLAFGADRNIALWLPVVFSKVHRSCASARADCVDRAKTIAVLVLS